MRPNSRKAQTLDFQAIFTGPEVPRKCLLGSLPKPGTLGLVGANFTQFASGHFVPKLTPFRCASSPHTARCAGPVRGPLTPKHWLQNCP